MEKKINIAELLKDCPSGMELDCTICNGVKFIELDRNPNFTIVVRTNNGYEFSLTKYGQVHNIDDAKCVIFPKGKTTWEGFVPFLAGDVIYTDNFIAILSNIEERGTVWYYCYYCIYTKRFKAKRDFGIGNINHDEFRLATEEEKQKLFQAIKDNGYKWNPETKTLEKLVEPIFEVGNKIEKCGYRFTITEVKDNYYLTKCGNKIPIDNQDDFKLVPDKFDITTLKPFESRVLVRTTDCDIWRPAIYGFTYLDRYYVVGGIYWKKCIPYNEETKHLLGTTDDCDEFYKTW